MKEEFKQWIEQVLIVAMWQVWVSNYRLNKTAEFTQIENICLRDFHSLAENSALFQLKFELIPQKIYCEIYN
jgi:hypothetical protein